VKPKEQRKEKTGVRPFCCVFHFLLRLEHYGDLNMPFNFRWFQDFNLISPYFVGNGNCSEGWRMCSWSSVDARLPRLTLTNKMPIPVFVCLV
jgi:hypothetical protein